MIDPESTQDDRQHRELAEPGTLTHPKARDQLAAINKLLVDELGFPLCEPLEG